MKPSSRTARPHTTLVKRSKEKCHLPGHGWEPQPNNSRANEPLLLFGWSMLGSNQGQLGEAGLGSLAHFSLQHRLFPPVLPAPLHTQHP